MRKELESVYKRAVDIWGVEIQMGMMIEEAAELIQAISKYKRAHDKSDEIKQDAYNHVCEEVADVENMIDQMRYMLDDKTIDIYKEQKLERTLEKIIKLENEQRNKKN